MRFYKLVLILYYYFSVVMFLTKDKRAQARIQDFEMGGEFL